MKLPEIYRITLNASTQSQACSPPVLYVPMLMLTLCLCSYIPYARVFEFLHTHYPHHPHILLHILLIAIGLCEYMEHARVLLCTYAHPQANVIDVRRFVLAAA